MRWGSLRHQVLGLMLLMVIVFVGSVGATGAGSAVVVNFTDAVIKARPGDIVDVSLVVDPNGYSIQSGEIVLFYDSKGLEVVNVSPGSLWGDTPLVIKKEHNDTSIVLVAAKPGSPATEPGAVLRVAFKVVGDEGSYIVRLVRVGFADSDGNDLPVYIETRECIIEVSASPAGASNETTTSTDTGAATKTTTIANTTTTATTSTVTTVTVTKTIQSTVTLTKVVRQTTTVVVPKTKVIMLTRTLTKSIPVLTEKTVTVTQTQWHTSTVTVTETKTTIRTLTEPPGWAYASLIAAISATAVLFLLIVSRR